MVKTEKGESCKVTNDADCQLSDRCREKKEHCYFNPEFELCDSQPKKK